MVKKITSFEKNKNIQYREAIVTFIDILGFKKMLLNLDVNGIYDVLRQFHLQHNQNSLSNHKEHGKNYETEVYFFSDSVVRIKYTGDEDLWLNTASDEVITLAEIQLNLFKQGILLRGGCTKGMIYSDVHSNILFGPALAEAYKIESELSTYPRIVVSESVWADYLKDMTTLAHWFKSDFIANRGGAFMEVADLKYITSGWKNDIIRLKLKKNILLSSECFINYFWGHVSSLIPRLQHELTFSSKNGSAIRKILTDTIETYLSLLLSYNDKIENDDTNDSVKMKQLWCRFHLHETIKDIYEWIEGYKLSDYIDIDLKKQLKVQAKLFFKRYGTKKIKQ